MSTVRTYYGNERVTVPGPNGTRLKGTVSGANAGRVTVGLDERTEFYPVGYDDDGVIPGTIAEVLERDLEFMVDGEDASAPSFSPEQLAYLQRTYGDGAVKVSALADSEAQNVAQPKHESRVQNDGTEEDDAAAAAEAIKAAAKASK